MENLTIRLDEYSPPAVADKTAYTRAVVCKEHAMNDLAHTAATFLAAGSVAVLFDRQVNELGNIAAEQLRKAGYVVQAKCADADEALREDIRLVVAVGGGSVADVAKIAATERGIDWIYMMTCASTDSALYPYTECVTDGVRSVAPCVPPIAVVADLSCVVAAPKNCTAAGYGTLFSKLLVLFSLRAAALPDGRHDPAENMLADNLLPFFDESSAEHIAVRIARTLIRIGLIAQCAPIDFLQREEYNAALVLSAYKDKTRLIGEDAMLASAAIALIYAAYFSHAPADLFVPCGYVEDFRLLDKLCKRDMLASIRDFERDDDCARKLFVLHEYRAELSSSLGALLGKTASCARTFRRIYGDAGFWLGEYVTPDLLARLVSLSAATLKDDSILRALKQSGLLDAAWADSPPLG